MRPQEARVFIIEDDPSKLGVLTDFVESNGGKVVGSVDSRDQAITEVRDSEFPANINNANVLLIDGNLDDSGGRGTDGEIIFRVGYERAVLHRADGQDGLGAIAIGSSIDPHSMVAYATGANLSLMSDPNSTTEDSHEQWRSLLEPQPIEPVYLSEGVMQRRSWENGWYLEDMVAEVLSVEPDGEETTIKVHSLGVRSTKQDGEEDIIVHSNDGGTTTESSVKEFIQKVEVQYDELKKRTIDKHYIQALVQIGDYLYFIKHSTEIRTNRFNQNGFVFTDGKTDKIAINTLDEIPDTYWKNIGLERPSIV